MIARKTGISVGEAMTTKPVICNESVSVQEAARIMQEKKVGSVIVLKDKHLLGLVTEVDVLYKIVAQGLPHDTPVSVIMTPSHKVTTIEPAQDILSAMELMRKRGIRRLPVLENNTFVGMLTWKDVLKIEPTLFDLAIDSFELREAERKPISERDLLDVLGSDDE